MPEELKKLAEDIEKLMETNWRLGRELVRAMNRISELLQENDVLREKISLLEEKIKFQKIS